jgi:hypothetical protein
MPHGSLTFRRGGRLLRAMFSVYFTRQGSVSIEPLLKRERFNFGFSTLTIRPNVIGSISMLRPKRRAQGHWPHIDNEKPQKSALSLQKIEEAWLRRLPQLPYSHNLAPCDFPLFRC